MIYIKLTISLVYTFWFAYKSNKYVSTNTITKADSNLKRSSKVGSNFLNSIDFLPYLWFCSYWQIHVLGPRLHFPSFSWKWEWKSLHWFLQQNNVVTAHWLGQLGEGETKEKSQEYNLKVSYMIRFSCELKVPSFKGWNLKDSSFCFWLLAIMLSQINLITYGTSEQTCETPGPILNPSIVG